ncbi:MAG: DUF6713 family protein [Chloroflexota bacterium]
MNSLIDLLFLTALAFLLIGHELDAIRQREWRFFFASISVSDQAAYRIFTALHVPLVVAILWYMESFWLQASLDIFAIAHAGIHWLLRKHPLIDFDNGFSRFWIYGAAALGGIHLIGLMIC